MTEHLYRPRQIVGETYQIRRLLGEGGMGQVYEAYDLVLHRLVAIKTPWPSLPADSLLAEARIMAAFRHEGLLGVLAQGVDAGRHFIVMERLYGQPLREHIHRGTVSGGCSALETIDILCRIADAVAALHAADLAHCDLKPDNIMLVPPRRVVLLDFGIAQHERFAEGSGEMIAGTPEYLAPEVVSGTQTVGTSHLADIYALGVVGYELLTGAPPFRGESATETVTMHLEQPVPDLTHQRPDVPVRLAALLGDMLAKDPHQRPPTIETVVTQLQAIRAQIEVDAETEPFRVLIVESDERMCRRLRHVVVESIPNVDVRTVESGEAALAMFRRTSPDVALLSLALPSMTGLELYLQLEGASLGGDTEFVLVSPDLDAADRHVIASLGIRNHLSQGKELETRMTDLLRRTVADRRMASTRQLVRAAR